MLRDGEIIREGSPAELTGGGPRPRSATAATARRSSSARPTRRARLHELTAEALARGEELEGLEVRRPTLEDVYLELTEEAR